MFGPNGEPLAASGSGASVVAPQRPQRIENRRWRRTNGRIGGNSISSYSPINSLSASTSKASPQHGQMEGTWSSKASGSSLSARKWPSCPGLAPPGLESSRRSLRSVDGGLEELREVLSGRCNRRTSSISSSLLRRSKSPRFIQILNQNPGGSASPAAPPMGLGNYR